MDIEPSSSSKLQEMSELDQSDDLDAYGDDQKTQDFFGYRRRSTVGLPRGLERHRRF